MAIDVQVREGFWRGVSNVPSGVIGHVGERFGSHAQDVLVAAARPNLGRRLVEWALQPASGEVDNTQDESLRQLGNLTLARTVVGRAWSAAFQCTDYGQPVSFGGSSETAFANTISAPYHPEYSVTSDRADPEQVSAAILGSVTGDIAHPNGH